MIRMGSFAFYGSCGHGDCFLGAIVIDAVGTCCAASCRGCGYEDSSRGALSCGMIRGKMNQIRDSTNQAKELPRIRQKNCRLIRGKRLVSRPAKRCRCQRAALDRNARPPWIVTRGRTRQGSVPYVHRL